MSEPLTPDEEKALREAWARIGGWERRDGTSDDDEYTCPLCNGEGNTDGFILDAKNVSPATLGGYGIGEGLAAAELVAKSTGRLLATIDQAREEARVQNKACAEEMLKREHMQRNWDNLVDQVRQHHEARVSAESERDEAWKATGVESTVRGLTTLADVVATYRRDLKEALAERDQALRMLEGLIASVETNIKVRSLLSAVIKQNKSEQGASGSEDRPALRKVADALRRKADGEQESKRSQFSGADTSESWNAAHPVGTPVRYWPILPPVPSSPPIDTTTRSEAWTLGDGSVVVSVAGKSGGVHLAHIELIEGGK